MIVNSSRPEGTAADQRCQAEGTAAAADKPGPSDQRKRRQPRQRNINMKKNGKVILKMAVQMRTIAPADVRREYY